MTSIAALLLGVEQSWVWPQKSHHPRRRQSKAACSGSRHGGSVWAITYRRVCPRGPGLSHPSAGWRTK